MNMLLNFRIVLKNNVLYSESEGCFHGFSRGRWLSHAFPTCSIEELVVHESEHRAAGLREVLGVLGSGA